MLSSRSERALNRTGAASSRPQKHQFLRFGRGGANRQPDAFLFCGWSSPIHKPPMRHNPAEFAARVQTRTTEAVRREAGVSVTLFL